MKEEKLTVKIELVGVEEAAAKAERYVELLKEAKTLADELASVNFEITSSSKLVRHFEKDRRKKGIAL